MFRPSMIEPLYGISSKMASYRVLYTLTKPLLPWIRAAFPDHVLTTEQIGRAMLPVASQGYPIGDRELHQVIDRRLEPRRAVKTRMEIKMKSLSRRKLMIGGAMGLVCLILLVAALRSTSKPPAQAMPAPEVEVARVEQKDVPIYSEWIGTLDGMVNAVITAQVSGYLLRQVYREGSFVKKGELLFEIDPRPFKAVVDQTKGELAKAQAQLTQADAQLLQSQAQLAQSEANQGKAQLDVNRYTPLAREQAITDQELDNAVQVNLAAKAQVKASSAGVETAKAAIMAANAAVAAALAAVETAELNLGFTKITSLIDGIAGIAQAQVGNLVSKLQ
jgi:multidrug efflux pump subunit AcrA (membrane-fusion protein)